MKSEYRTGLLKVDEKSNKLVKKVGVFCCGADPLGFIKLLGLDDFANISGIYTDESQIEIVNALAPGLYTNNPFGLISNSDIVLVVKTDDSSFNLMVESILNYKSVIIASPWNLQIDELEKLEKLSREASVKVFPLLDFPYWGFVVKNSSLIDLSLHSSIRFSKDSNNVLSLHEVRSLLFSLMYLAFYWAKAGSRKVYVNNVPVRNNELSLINVWLDFDNGSSAEIQLNLWSEISVLDAIVYQKGRQINFNMLENSVISKTESCKTEQFLIEDNFGSGAFYRQILHIINRKSEKDTISIHSGNFRNILTDFLKVAEKL